MILNKVVQKPSKNLKENKMKFAIFLAILSLIVASCQVQAQQQQDNPAYTGQPGCQTEEEVSVGLYPHFRIKRAYWKCSVLGQPAVLEYCPIAQGYLDPAKACVSWIEWYWTPTVAPPSIPAAGQAEGSGQ